MMLRITITGIVSFFTYLFFVEEYNYPSYSAFGMAAAAALFCFLIGEDIEHHKKVKEEKRWEDYRQRVIEATSKNVEQEKVNKEVKAEDYNFLFAKSENNETDDD